MTTGAVLARIADADPLTVIGLDDPVVAALGHHPTSDYAETYWLSVIGPSALWALRRLTRWLDDSPDGYPLALGPFAAELGLGHSTSTNSPVVRTLGRLVDLKFAALGGNCLAVRRHLPPLTMRQTQRLPGHLADQHRRILEGVAS